MHSRWSYARACRSTTEFCGYAQRRISLSEEYDEDEDILRYEEEEVFPDDLFFSFYYYSLQVLLLGKPLLDEANEEEGKLLELLTEIDH